MRMKSRNATPKQPHANVGRLVAASIIQSTHKEWVPKTRWYSKTRNSVHTRAQINQGIKVVGKQGFRVIVVFVVGVHQEMLRVNNSLRCVAHECGEIATTRWWFSCKIFGEILRRCCALTVGFNFIYGSLTLHRRRFSSISLFHYSHWKGMTYGKGNVPVSYPTCGWMNELLRIRKTHNPTHHKA